MKGNTMANQGWTVIGYYDLEDQAFADYVMAPDQFQAMAKIGKKFAETDLIIVGAIKGSHDLYCMSEDNGMTVYANDAAAYDAELADA